MDGYGDCVFTVAKVEMEKSQVSIYIGIHFRNNNQWNTTHHLKMLSCWDPCLGESQGHALCTHTCTCARTRVRAYTHTHTLQKKSTEESKASEVICRDGARSVILLGRREGGLLQAPENACNWQKSTFSWLWWWFLGICICQNLSCYTVTMSCVLHASIKL